MQTWLGKSLVVTALAFGATQFAHAEQSNIARWQSVIGIAQGGTDRELRRRSANEIAELGFDGNALGGLAIGESREEMLDTTAWAAQLLPVVPP